MNKIKLLGLSILVLVLLQQCRQKTTATQTNTDSLITGTAKMACDESFSRIVDQEAYVYKARYPRANPEISYVSENDVLRQLLDDSVRAVFLSRDLNANEKKVLQTRNLTPATSRFAIDAVVLIVNKMSNDTVITISEIKKMLAGQAKTDKNIVFDNPGSSLLRYMMNLAGSSDIKLKNLFSLKTNKDVIKYVSTHPNAIGITSFSWVDDPDDDYADAANNVKVMAVKNEADKKFGKQYFLPSQTSLALNQYPLSRNLYIVNCTDRRGLATGFAGFINSERGQRIILKSGILPDSIPPREIVIKKTLN